MACDGDCSWPCLLLFMLSSGLTLIFSMMGVLNFAHASFYMLGAYIAYTLSNIIGFWPALFLAPCYFALNYTYFLSLDLTSASETMTINASTGVWTLLAERLVLGERITWLRLATVSVSVGGLGLVTYSAAIRDEAHTSLHPAALASSFRRICSCTVRSTATRTVYPSRSSLVPIVKPPFLAWTLRTITCGLSGPSLATTSASRADPTSASLWSQLVERSESDTDVSSVTSRVRTPARTRFLAISAPRPERPTSSTDDDARERCASWPITYSCLL